MPISFLLKLAGVAEPLWRVLRSVAAWIFSDLRHVAIAVLLAGGAYWYFNASGLKAENTELRKTVFDITEAQKLATKLAKQEKARIEAENERKSERAKADFESRLAANNAALRNWLQNNRRTAHNANLPEASKAPEGTAEAGAAAVIPEDFALVPIADLELSAQAFAKLEALQSWAREVSNAD